MPVMGCNRFVVRIEAKDDRTRQVAQRLIDMVKDCPIKAVLGDTAKARYQVTLDDLQQMRQVRDRLKIMAAAVRQGAELELVDDPTLFAVQATLFAEAGEALRVIAAGPPRWRRVIDWLKRRLLEWH